MLRISLLALCGVLALASCADETISAYADPSATYRLTELDGTPFGPVATIGFSKRKRIAGRAPCNSFSGPLDAVYPWFDAGPLVSSKRLCADIDDERRFLAALEAVTLAEVSGSLLVLSNEQGLEMVFRKSAVGP